MRLKGVSSTSRGRYRERPGSQRTGSASTAWNGVTKSGHALRGICQQQIGQASSRATPAALLVAKRHLWQVPRLLQSAVMLPLVQEPRAQ